MTVSWLIPHYNANPEWLKQTILSCVNQDKDKGKVIEYEIVLVNDGTEGFDESPYRAELAALSDRIVFVTCETNRGVAGALNWGLEYAQGDWVARIDADDWNEPSRLRKQLKFATKGGLDACGTGMYAHGDQVIHARDLTDRATIKDIIEKKRGVPIYHPTLLIKRELLKDGYPTDYPWAEDFALWIRGYERKWALGNLDEPLVHYRIHKGSVGQTHFVKQRDSVDKALRSWHLLK